MRRRKPPQLSLAAARRLFLARWAEVQARAQNDGGGGSGEGAWQEMVQIMRNNAGAVVIVAGREVSRGGLERA